LKACVDPLQAGLSRYVQLAVLDQQYPRKFIIRYWGPANAFQGSIMDILALSRDFSVRRTAPGRTQSNRKYL
jgi:hypothetical protein